MSDFTLSEWSWISMIRLMLLRFVSFPVVAAAFLMVVSCGGSPDIPLVGSNLEKASSEADQIYTKAKAADDAGKQSKAVRLYDRLATRYPFTSHAADARYRQAEILESRGKVEDSFDAYQQFLTRYQGSGLYSKALKRQTEMAQSAADGDVKYAFLGIKSKLSLDKTVGMLTKVKQNAPQTRTASKAQFTIGQLYESKGKTKEAIAAYRELVRDQPESPEAPEGLFKVGDLLTKQADEGNQNQATLDLAREAFNDYLTQYPGHSKNAEARQRVKSLGKRELDRTMDIAEFYLKTGKIDSAKVYYRDIVRRTKSGEIHDAAKARLKQLGE
ncbi:tetratricopeptide repeat protein [Luteolibacter pohnpeiensis]|uniref:Tetratricopeptide repeat protein n=1 Tax=Luteolibacter pohnpeiensis TaxID=454153 RepID=A0A934VY97_9BACT|nr:tetratricopeptide repeat protein [Luteolibacter pohnpeiensis]MBK1884329.1 tetratricopeptide repeat protein [Luteolibacter pohnpeiensis]